MKVKRVESEEYKLVFSQELRNASLDVPACQGPLPLRSSCLSTQITPLRCAAIVLSLQNCDPIPSSSPVPELFCHQGDSEDPDETKSDEMLAVEVKKYPCYIM